jgi:hypothetical protein
MTDLVVASEKGIGFFDFIHPDLPPQVALNNISFKQVVSSEKVDPANPTSQTIITLFAVSDDDELYYIQGIRPFQTNKITFTASGIPIRDNVDRISTQYNAAKSATELIYLGNGTNEVFHLWLDSGLTWQEEQILTRGPSGYIKYYAFITTLTFVTDKGLGVGQDYPLVC